MLRGVATAAPRWLAPGGHVLVEMSERQVPQAVDAFTRGGLVPRVIVDEEFCATVVSGQSDAALHWAWHPSPD